MLTPLKPEMLSQAGLAERAKRFRTVASSFHRNAELLLADDVSSALDATTEIELWKTLRERRVTVIGATSKRAALAQADRVVVLVDGEVAAIGPWSELSGEWAQLAG